MHKTDREIICRFGIVNLQKSLIRLGLISLVFCKLNGAPCPLVWIKWSRHRFQFSFNSTRKKREREKMAPSKWKKLIKKMNEKDTAKMNQCLNGIDICKMLNSVFGIQCCALLVCVSGFIALFTLIDFSFCSCSTAGRVCVPIHIAC